MQSFSIIDPGTVILVETLLAFILLISYGLYRYSTGVRYKLWAIGWFAYAATASTSILTTGIGLVMTDTLATSGMFVGSVFLFDGARKHQRQGWELLIYVIAAIIGFVTVPVGLSLGITYGFVFSIAGVVSTFACWYSAIQFRNDVSTRSLDFWVVCTGFIVWGIATLLFIPFELVALLDIQVMITATGIIVTGASLLSYLIRTTTDNLGSQYQISQLLGSLLSHDIRNYVGSLSESIDQALASEAQREIWLGLASEIITSMTDFVMDMRYVTSTVTRAESGNSSMNLASILEEVTTRVAREYGLESGKIVIELGENISICSCKIVKELFWNIIDNAFKHGTEGLTVKASRNMKDVVTVEILDRAGGMPNDIREFLNSPDSLASPSAPGIGLGIILIRGLSSLCNIPMESQNIIEDGTTIGTRFQLHFEYDTQIL